MFERCSHEQTLVLQDNKIVIGSVRGAPSNLLDG